jgi:2-polyprenyl-3-methyl-5-hydroxy-6-metoxy-1,4-benzoquinol methylase
MAVCGACRSTLFGTFFRAQEASVTGLFFDQPTPTEPATIELEYCKSCGLIRQVPDRMIRLNYERIIRGTAQQLPAYVADIFSSLAGSGVGNDDLILEIGANDGTFLKALRAQGYHNLVGVEPSKQLADAVRQSGFDIESAYFDQKLAAQLREHRGGARVVICRHTLEHVPDIVEFTKAIAAVLSADGMAMIEVPDADWLVTNLFAHEIWDEHISYFRPRSLAALLGNCGLRPIRLERMRQRDARNLLCWSVPASVNAIAPCVTEDEAGFEAVERFQARWDGFAERLRSNVLASPRPVIAIGAAHPQLNFLNFSGLGAAVDTLVDDDPAKAGRFAPLARAVPVRTTSEILATARQGTLLRTGFPYPAWEDRIERALAVHNVRSIRPYGLLESALEPQRKR